MRQKLSHPVCLLNIIFVMHVMYLNRNEKAVYSVIRSKCKAAGIFIRKQATVHSRPTQRKIFLYFQGKDIRHLLKNCKIDFYI